jgi:AraC-like DNA-binding protein
MVDLIEQTFADRTTLKTVSAGVTGSPGHLGRLFRRLTGTTIHEYVTRVRLDHAAHFIRLDVKVEAVALAVGYQSKKNFYRQFTRHFGVTPEAYRRRRVMPANGHVPGKKRPTTATTYSATFGEIDCLIDVESRLSVKGRPSFTATPFVKLDHGIQPFSAASYLEVAGESEPQALEAAAVFLEHRFGPRQAQPQRFSDGVLRILTPRR